jgi:hypothetical protein
MTREDRNRNTLCGVPEILTDGARGRRAGSELVIDSIGGRLPDPRGIPRRLQTLRPLFRPRRRWSLLATLALALSPAARSAVDVTLASDGRVIQLNDAGSGMTAIASPAMPKDAAKVLATSKDREELLAYARLLARSGQSADHNALRKRLESREFLARLDEPERHQGAPEKLRLNEVLRELSANRAASAEAALVALTRSPGFRAEPLRIELLIRACVPIRPAPADVIRFWDEHWMPDDGYSHLTAGAVCDNGSASALTLLEKKMADPAHSDDDKRVWMVTAIMMHRNDAPMLESCERMVRGGLPERLRPLLVEALFDYRPLEWFRPATVLVPPDRKLAGAAARDRLRRIGEFALQSVALSEAQRNVVRGVLEEIKEHR